MSTDLAFLSATDLLAGYRRKRFSPVEATLAALAQIDRHNGVFNAFCLVDHAAANRAGHFDGSRGSRERGAF